jgi:SHS family sialic acid transporter-like MFS transporter
MTALSAAGPAVAEKIRWRPFFATWLGYFLDGFDFILITLVLTEVAATFHLSLVVASTLVSAAFVSRWLGGLALGAIGDRFGRKPAMILSICCFAVGSVLCGVSWDYWSLFVFRAIVGIGMAGEYGASASYAMESWPPRRRNVAAGALLSAYPIGTIAASLLYGVIVPHFGWRVLFFVGIVPVVVALVMRRSLPEADQWVAEVERRKGVAQTTAEVLFSPRRRALNIAVSVVVLASLVLVFSGNSGALLWPLAILTALGFIVFAVQLAARLWPMVVLVMVTVFAAFMYSWPTQSLLPTYLKTNLHYDPALVSVVLTWAGLGYAAGSVVWGLVADRIGTRLAYVIGLVINLMLIAPVFLIGGGNVPLLILLLFAMQFAGQGISGLLPKYVSDHFPTRIRAAGLGFSYNVGALGGAVAPLLGATLAAGFGNNVGTAIMVLALCFTTVIALLIGFNVPALVGRAIGGSDDETPALAAKGDDVPGRYATTEGAHEIA